LAQFFDPITGVFNKFGLDSGIPIDLVDLLVRANQKEATVAGEFYSNGEALHISVHLRSSTGQLTFEGDKKKFKEFLSWKGQRWSSTEDLGGEFLRSLTGMNSEPLILPPLMYFHSYRKVQEGNPELGRMVESERSQRERGYLREPENVISTFKVELLRSMMSVQGLFDMDGTESSEVLDVLQDLMTTYAGGRVEKLRPRFDNTLEFRVSPNDGGPSFAFDGLSSGQKEIISTLFLIWRHTHSRPGIVLIDEPELHLNAEWHKLFVEQLARLVPQNQYILATHSEDVFGAVPESHRILLVGDGAPAHA
jgi:hypothetical protein